MIIQLQNVCKKYKSGTTALSDVSFSVNQGEFVSVIGPSGAGKTTLFRILNGAAGADSGSVIINEKHLETAKGRKLRMIQKSIGTIYQDFALVENMSCIQNVLSACLPDMAFIPAVFGLFGAERKREAARLLARVGIADKADEPVKNLSGGQKQRVAIARALMRRPSVLLADEPASSLDPVTGRQILALLADIQKTQELTILMNSHNLNFSLEFSSRIIGLNDGRVVFDGAPSDASPKVISDIYGDSGTGCDSDVEDNINNVREAVL